MKLLLVLCLLTLPAFAQKKGDVVVATKQTLLKRAEARRGERWEITKYSKDKVELTFGPGDERREALARIGKTFSYEIDGAQFVASFVPESQWPAKRKELSTGVHQRFPDLTAEQCEKIIDGELWMGMTKDQAFEAAGVRILKKETSQTAAGTGEIWRVGYVSQLTAIQSMPAAIGLDRDFEGATRLILTFENGKLVEIVKR
jgi:hypothetical protein